MTLQKTFAVSALIAAGSLLAACRKSQDAIIARVGGAEITKSDVETSLKDIPSAYQHYLVSAEGRKRFIQSLIQEKVLLLEARRTGLARTSAYREEIRQSRTRMKRQMKKYEEDLLIRSYVRQLQSKDLAVPDAEVRRSFEDHRAEYEKPLEVQASHILLGSEAAARQALDRLKAGEPFEKVARAMSKDPATAVRGGKLSPFRRGALVPEFEEAAFRLKTGAISEIVKTQFGFHLIKKTGQTQLPSKSFEDAKEEIRARLEREKFDQWVTRKQETLGVTIDEKAVDSLESMPASDPSQEPTQP